MKKIYVGISGDRVHDGDCVKVSHLSIKMRKYQVPCLSLYSDDNIMA
jgi:hypothetical protein